LLWQQIALKYGKYTHKLNPVRTQKVLKIFYETWNMCRWQSGDAHLFLFSLCWKMWLFGLKYGKYNNICDYSKSSENIILKLKIWKDGSLEIIHMILIFTIGSMLRVVQYSPSFGDFVQVFTLFHYKFFISKGIYFFLIIKHIICGNVYNSSTKFIRIAPLELRI
jgi:hypothetical protein